MWLHFESSAPYRPNLSFFYFWHSGTLALSPEHQSARKSEIKNGKLDLDGKV